MKRASLARAGVLLFAFATPTLAIAQTKTAIAQAGNGQAPLHVGFDERGVLRAIVCKSEPCLLAQGKDLGFPAELRPAIPRAKLAVVGIGNGRRAISVEVTDAQREFRAIVVAPLAGTEPKLIFSGFTGLLQGQDGLRKGPMLSISEPDREGARSILVGEQREELSLCGRPTIIAPQLLNPADLALHPAKVQRLTAAERERAQVVTAEEVPDSTPPAARVLRALAASSAVGSPQALTDGDPETTWAENRGGSGRGEFVVMNAPPEVALNGFEFVIRPTKSTPERGVSPREFFLATARDVVRIKMPEDAWQKPGARYRIKLESPLQGDCLALVTDSGFDESREARVTFAEFGGVSEFNASALPELVAALAGGGQRAEAAKSVLRSGGPSAFEAVANAFAKLDEGGRRVALEVMDAAPCETSIPVYLQAFSSTIQGQRIHARARLRRCGKPAAQAIAREVPNSKGKLRFELAGELSLLSPELAVDALAPLLDTPHPDTRRRLRVEIARTASEPEAAQRIRARLADANTTPRVTLELLRAVGPRITSLAPESTAALERLLREKPDFNTRYLLLAPMALLATSDEKSREALRSTINSEKDWRLRAHATSVIQTPTAFQKELVQSLADPEVRVREAAVQTLSQGRAEFAGVALANRLSEDRWPLIRAAAAEALGGLGPKRALDEKLADALDDESHLVRAKVVMALGTRRAGEYVEPIRERFSDDEERLEVRTAAALALGALCDQNSVEPLTQAAHKLVDRMAENDVRALGAASLAALARIGPKDLRKRLAPLLGEQAPRAIRHTASVLISRPGSCSSRGPAATGRSR